MPVQLQNPAIPHINSRPSIVCIVKTNPNFNLQGRLETVTTTPYTGGGAGTACVVTYKYNPQGIRVSKDVDGVITDYLIDPYNHTGHAQVIEETTDDGIDLTRIQYTIGDDVIAQTESTYDSGWTASDTEYLLYDGHGSTRQLAKQDKSHGSRYNRK